MKTMAFKNLKIYLLVLAFVTFWTGTSGQGVVPFGIHYQAVARDNYGKELANTNISVRFSIISGDPDGVVVYQEIHQNIITSKYGVFSLVIGSGAPTANGNIRELSDVEWDKAFHYLKVEVKFANDYLDMGTMQFLAVPYALYAQKSLEPGPQGLQGIPGPKGEPGDPASDNQTLSFDESKLSISGGNSLPLTGLLQNLTVINGDDGIYLGISRGNSVKLATIEADGDPTNEIQDITLNSDKLKITNNSLATEWDLTRYLDNTDSQALTWDPVTRVLGVSGNSATINLSELKDDADADPSNELQDLNLTGNKLTITNKATPNEIDLSKYSDNTDSQTLAYSDVNKTLTVSGGNTVSIGSIIAFRAGISASYNLPDNSPVDLIFDQLTGKLL